MTYEIGDEIPLHQLTSVTSRNYRVAVIARGSIHNGVVAVGCHQHPLSVILTNGGKVETEDPPRTPDRPLVVTAYATIRHSPDYGGNVMKWEGRVRSDTGMSEITQYAHRVEVVGLPDETAAEERNGRITVQQGVYACTVHPHSHFFIVGANRRGEGIVSRLETGSGHGHSGQWDSHWPECRVRRGASAGYFFPTGAHPDVEVSVSAEQERLSVWTS